MPDEHCRGFLPILMRLVAEAGAAIRAHHARQQPVEHRSKADNSPLTEADLASHDVLARGLAGTGIPVLSEESPPAELQGRHAWPRCWLVDPLDGTKEFIARSGEFTINIALVEAGRASLGLVAVPMRGAVYLGVPGAGAWKWQGGGGFEADVGTGTETGPKAKVGAGTKAEAGAWVPIAARRADPSRPLVVYTSSRHRGEQLDTWLGGLPGEVRREHYGSALKFCLLAEGLGDLYPRFAPCSEWDTAAGEALLEGAGGALRAPSGAGFTYNRRAGLINGPFIAAADATSPHLPR